MYHTHAHTHTRTRTRIYLYTHARARTHARAHTRAHTRAHIGVKLLYELGGVLILEYTAAPVDTSPADGRADGRAYTGEQRAASAEAEEAIPYLSPVSPLYLPYISPAPPRPRQRRRSVSRARTRS